MLLKSQIGSGDAAAGLLLSVASSAPQVWGTFNPPDGPMLIRIPSSLFGASSHRSSRLRRLLSAANS